MGVLGRVDGGAKGAQPQAHLWSGAGCRLVAVRAARSLNDGYLVATTNPAQRPGPRRRPSLCRRQLSTKRQERHSTPRTVSAPSPAHRLHNTVCRPRRSLHNSNSHATHLFSTQLLAHRLHNLQAQARAVLDAAAVLVGPLVDAVLSVWASGGSQGGRQGEGGGRSVGSKRAGSGRRWQREGAGPAANGNSNLRQLLKAACSALMRRRHPP